MNRRSTLRDVASESGVAVSTVSGILNNRSDSWVSQATRERVHAAAKKLDFIPNRLARGLRLNHHNMAFAILPDLNNPFFANLSRFLRISFESKGYELTSEETEFKRDRESRILEGLPARYSDGVIATLGNVSLHADFLKKLSQKLPLVILGPGFAESGLDTVGSDIKTGIQEAMMHLAELGHRQIGLIDSLMEVSDPIARQSVFRTQARQLGLTLGEESCVHCTCDLGHIRHAVQSWARALPPSNRPTALLCTNDMTALAAMRGLQDADLAVPADMSIIGCDNITLGEYLHCPLTTISQPTETLAQMASDILLGRITGQRVGPAASILLPTRLLIRSSTGRPPASKVRNSSDKEK
jgi:LacI family transcriptional regulator